MGIAENGRDLFYGFEIAVATDPTKFVRFPKVPVTLATTDRRSMVEHVNLAADAKRSFLKMLAPDAVVSLDGLERSDLEVFRALALGPNDFYILRLLRKERFRAWASLVFLEGATKLCLMPHSSYSLASKRSVDNGGASLFSGIRVVTDWSKAVQHDTSATNLFTSYADTDEKITLTAGAPSAGGRVYITFEASGWLAKLSEVSWRALAGTEAIHDSSLTFEGV